MKIVLAAGLYPPDIGGPATFASQLANSLHTQGVQVVVVPFHTVRHSKQVLRHLKYFCKLYRASKDAHYIVALDPVSVGLPAVLTSVLRRVPLVLRVGGDFAWEQGVQRFNVTKNLDEFVAAPSSVYPFMVLVLQRIQLFVARHASLVIAPSEYLRKIITAWGVEQGKVRRIYSSATVGALPSKSEARDIYKLTDEKVIVSAGRFVPWKGFPVLMEAVAGLQREVPNVRLYIAGSGPENAKLREIGTQLLGDAVVFMGDMQKKDLQTLVRAADVFALNTNYEGLSHQLIEVMQVGTPIVTTRVGGNLELIEDKVSGFLVAYNDVTALEGALSNVLKNDSRVMSAHAREKAQMFAEGDSMAEWASLLGVREGGPNVLMISGDPRSLVPTSAVFTRLLLQAYATKQLIVYTRGRTKEMLLGEHGVVRGMWSSKLLMIPQMIHRGVREKEIDIVTAQDPFFLGFIGWRIAQAHRASLQIQIHTNICAPEFKQAYKFKTLLARYMLKKATSLRVVSKEIRDHLIAEGCRIPIEVLPIYIDTEAIDRAPEYDNKTAHPQFTHHIAVAARLEKEKYIDEIIVALPDIIKRLPGTGLLIAGTGSYAKVLKRLVKKLGVQDSVVFLGYVGGDEVFSFYKGADVVFAATAPYEGYGATAIEALVAGRPVVATRDAGIVREAGGVVVVKAQLAYEIVRLITAGIPGVLRIALPNKEAWATLWRESLEPVKVEE